MVQFRLKIMLEFEFLSFNRNKVSTHFVFLKKTRHKTKGLCDNYDSEGLSGTF